MANNLNKGNYIVHKLLLNTALVAGLSAAAPANAFSWSSITNFFTQRAPYTATRIDYQGPMARPASFGGASYYAYPAQTESAIAYARRTSKPIHYVQGSSGTTSKVVIGGITYPGVRLYSRYGTYTTDPHYQPSTLTDGGAYRDTNGNLTCCR